MSPRDSALTPTIPDDDGPVEVKVVPVVDPASYELGEEIARGGMGRIVAARDRRLGRTVAIKILLTQRPALAARFAREATITARLQHPSIVPVHETGRLPSGEPFYVMKLVAGRSLDVEIAARTSLQDRMTLLPNVIAVVDALAYAHSQQIIHRDLKPSNVLIGAFGETVVIDWGVARDLAATERDPNDSAEMAAEKGLTASGGVVGTPAFMPPEQARGGEVDERADVYALGALLYHVLAGTAPYSGTSVEVIESVLAGPPTPIAQRAPELPADLLAIVDKSMQREPAARYASAQELAEDLRRFQDGRMVSARSYSLRTRAARFVGRHRLAVALALLATVAAAVPLAMWQAARADAAAVADAAQRFGQLVERIESGLRQAYLLPLHDIRDARAEVRRQIDDIARDRSLVARAAVGRGYLALGDHVRARAALEDAIAGGYGPPDIAYAYGRTLGALYQQARVDLQRVKDTHLRAARLAAAQVILRDPALAYLKMGERPVYGEALIAFYEGRYDDAIAGARRAFEQSPALYEAKALEGEVLAQRALEAQTKGSYPDALRDSAAAGTAYAAAIDVARSDPALRLAECVRWRYLLNTQGWTDAQTEKPQKTFEHAIAVCHDVQTADPDSPAAAEELSNVYGIHGEWQTYHGEDPNVANERAIRFGIQAVGLAPGRALAHATLGLAQVRHALYQIKTGVDPVPNLRAGIATYNRAVAIEPTQTMYNSLGVAYRNLASYEADPEPSLQKAIESYRKALELNPSYSYAYNNITAVYQRRAEIALARGQDPASDVAQAIASSQQALKLNPKFAFAAEGIGISHLLAGRYRAMHGDDPAGEFAQALDALATSSKLDPNFGTAHREAGSVLVDHAQYALDTGGDPEPLLAKARDELGQARALDKNDDDVPRLQAEAERIAGELAKKTGASPDASFAAAARLLDEAEAMNNKSADLFEARAKLALARARSRVDKAELEAGIKAADRALELDGTRSLPYALRGELLRLAGSPEADASFATALSRNPLLARKYKR